MKNNIFRKKFNDLGPNVSDKIDEIFEGETKSDTEFVAKFKSLSSKARKKAIQIAGAGLVSLLVLSGFTGCVDKNGNITETTIDQVPDSQETPSSVLNEYTSTASPSQTAKPQESTTRSPETSTSAPTTETTGRHEETTTGRPTTETTGRPEETTTAKPEETTTARPEETTTSKPEETTTEAPVVTPVEPEKLPWFDENYVYPVYLTNFIASNITDYESTEILYVQPEPYEVIFDLKTSFYIYSKHTDKSGNKHYYRTAFHVDNEFAIGDPTTKRYSRYSDYVDALVNLMQTNGVSRIQCTSCVASASVIDEINNSDTSKFAKILGDEYVSVKILFNAYEENAYDGTQKNHTYPGYVRNITGFAYTADGKCECFTLQLDPYNTDYVDKSFWASAAGNKTLARINDGDRLLQDLANGTLTREELQINKPVGTSIYHWGLFRTYTQELFTPENQAEQTEQSAQ